MTKQQDMIKSLGDIDQNSRLNIGMIVTCYYIKKSFNNYVDRILSGACQSKGRIHLSKSIFVGYFVTKATSGLLVRSVVYQRTIAPAISPVTMATADVFVCHIGTDVTALVSANLVMMIQGIMGVAVKVKRIALQIGMVVIALDIALQRMMELGITYVTSMEIKFVTKTGMVKIV